MLVKRPKPIQERRIDLPVDRRAHRLKARPRAGLAGIAVEAHGALAVRRAEIDRRRRRAGLFVYGFTRAEVGEA